MAVALAMFLTVLVSLSLAQPPDVAARRAWEDVRAASDALKRQRGKQYRHRYLAVISSLERFAVRHPRDENAPRAHFRAAELKEMLSRHSEDASDAHQALKAWRALAERLAPAHALADDVALRLARLQARQGMPSAARETVARALPGATDQKRALQKLLASLPRGPGPRERPAAPVQPVARRVEPPSPRPADDEGAAPSTQAPPAQLARALRGVAGLDGAAAAMASASASARRVPEARPGGDVPRPHLLLPAPVDAAAATGLQLGEGEEEPTPADETTEEHSALVAFTERLRDLRVGPTPAVEAPRRPAPGKALLQKELRAQGARPAGDVTLAQELGLKVRRVILDAGHGGHDTGAIGPSGTREKDVALAIVLKLKRLLEEAGLEVVLVRDDDTFVALEERAAVANAKGGDLFLSIHCNAAASHSLRGIETYTLNTGSTRYARRLAARENATSQRTVSELGLILADLATKANTGESQQLASLVQRGLVQELRRAHPDVVDLGTKEALFFVLLGARMPAILVETSFLSHPEEEKRLASEGYQEAIARSISSSVQQFLGQREKLAQAEVP